MKPALKKASPPEHKHRGQPWCLMCKLFSERLEAASRLAGRLEQAEISVKIAKGWALVEQRDRLRREGAGK